MVLVTGGAGYIGSHTVCALTEAGFGCLVLDNLEKGHIEAVKGVPAIRGDLRSPSDIEQAFCSYGVTSVVHLAAYSEVGESVQFPDKYFENNVTGTRNLLDAMETHGVDKIVFSSSAAVYGEPKTATIDESHPTAPSSPYGESKLRAEREITSRDIKSVCLRYFNASGASPTHNIGEDHSPETHLVPRLLLSLLGRTTFQIYGSDYDTPDGTCVRDYVHVSDLARAHVDAVRFLENSPGNHVFNLGSGHGASVSEVVAAAAKVTNKSISPPVTGRRPGDPSRLVASNELAKKVLGWAPEHQDLETIVEHAWHWHRRFPDGYKGVII